MLSKQCEHSFLQRLVSPRIFRQGPVVFHPTASALIDDATFCKSFSKECPFRFPRIFWFLPGNKGPG